MSTQRNNLKGSLILCFASLIWGLAFVAQSSAAENVPPFLFNSLRSFVAAIFLFGVLLVRKAMTKRRIFPTEAPSRRRSLLSGLLCGILLTVSVNFQQIGIASYPAGTATEARGGFITALYVVIVPLLAIFLGKRLQLPVVGAVLISIVGFYLLCLSDGLDSIYLGDLLMLCCALSFSFHILTVDHIGASVDGILLSMLQFAVCGLLSGVLSMATETVVWEKVLLSTFDILYVGILSSGVAYTLQIVGQKYAEPAIASLSMSLESVFAALGGWVILGNTLTSREFLGCALVFLAIILAQLPQLFAERRGRT
ncbi:MAG: DMT family transporter [Clostridia bacterium]|nr:DMT family transporter [Clostridia bacterium]